MLDRLEHVARASKARGMSQQRLCEAAGLSPGWMSGALTRAKKESAYRPDHETLAKLADAAGVSLRWLEDGDGAPDEGVPVGAVAPVAAPQRLPARQVPENARPAQVALLEAFKRAPGSFTAEDALAALDAIATTEAMLPRDPERAVATMGRMLTAVSRLRREGAPVTFQAIALKLAEPADADDNEEGRAELAALGAQPPAEPVRTPARGLPIVPRPPEKKTGK